VGFTTVATPVHELIAARDDKRLLLPLKQRRRFAVIAGIR
jgi:hypothetical protein